MKKYLLGVLLLAPGLSLAQTTYPFVVKGKIGSLNAPAKVYLLGEKLDSATLKNGQFELKGASQWLGSAELILERKGKLRENYNKESYFRSPDRTTIFLEPGPVVVTSPDSLTHARIAGGPLTADYERLNAALKPIIDQFKTANSQAQFKAFNTAYAQAARAFVKANPTSWVSLELLQQLTMLAPPQYAEVAPLYEAFSPALKNSPPGRQYGEMLQGLKVTAIGAEAPTLRNPRPKASKSRFATTGASTCWSISGLVGAAPAGPKTQP
jgi:hypothetical protein